MLKPELKKLLNDLRNGTDRIEINREKIREELEYLDKTPRYVQHSLSLSTDVCPTCGRRL